MILVLLNVKVQSIISPIQARNQDLPKAGCKEGFCRMGPENVHNLVFSPNFIILDDSKCHLILILILEFTDF